MRIPHHQCRTEHQHAEEKSESSLERCLEGMESERSWFTLCSVHLVADVETDVKPDRLAAVQDAATQVRLASSSSLICWLIQLCAVKHQAPCIRLATAIFSAVCLSPTDVSVCMHAEMHCGQHSQESGRATGNTVQQAQLLQGVDIQKQ